ncbi:MAG: hypothetical protein K2Q22_01310, partial [Cytophagales bacterium]|nr:hypothetical protein [Cytophagales bacterium]
MKTKSLFFAGLFLMVVFISSCLKPDLPEQKNLYKLIYDDEYKSSKDIFRSIRYRTRHDNLTSKGKIAPKDSLRLAIAEEYVSDFDSSFSTSKVGLLVNKMDEYFIQRGRKDHALRSYMNLLYSKLKSSEDSLDYLQLKIVLVKILKMQLEDLSLEISGNYTQRWFSMMNFNNEIVSDENYVVGDTVRILLFPPKNDLNGNWCKAR